MSIFRLTGTAGRVHERSGTSGEGDNKRAWTMKQQEIVIGPLLSTKFDLTDGDSPFGMGEQVDIAVEVTAKGGYLRVEMKGEYPKPAAAPSTGPTPLAKAV